MIFQKTIEHLDALKMNREDFSQVLNELKNAERVVQAAKNVVKNPAWAGICDEDIDLERMLKQGGYL